MVGGRDYSASQFNRAIQAKRQAGSAFKPIVYAAALDKGFTPATLVVDEPFSFEDIPGKDPWQPQNFDREFWGPITVRKALTFSQRSHGPDCAVHRPGLPDQLYHSNQGFKTKLEPNLSGPGIGERVPLGQARPVLPPRDTADPVLISQIQDKDGNMVKRTSLPRSK
jgi:penicillin-binding protein 1A